MHRVYWYKMFPNYVQWRLSCSWFLIYMNFLFSVNVNIHKYKHYFLMSNLIKEFLQLVSNETFFNRFIQLFLESNMKYNLSFTWSSFFCTLETSSNIGSFPIQLQIFESTPYFFFTNKLSNVHQKIFLLISKIQI